MHLQGAAVSHTQRKVRDRQQSLSQFYYPIKIEITNI